MYRYVCVCVYVDSCGCVHACVMGTCIYNYIFIYKCMCKYMYIHVYMGTCMHLGICVCMKEKHPHKFMYLNTGFPVVVVFGRLWSV